jgi:sugar phosphate isomerase/epimerase
MQLGLSSYTYAWAVGVEGYLQVKPLSAFDLVNKTQASGLSLVQIADNLPLETWSSEKLMDLFNYAKSRNISLEMGGRGLTTAHAIKCLNVAELLDSRILRMVIDGPGFSPDLQTIISIILELLPELKSRNILLAIENHDRFKAKEFEKIVLKTDPDFVGICLDSVNSMGAGEGFESVSDILIPYTINLHVKDFTIFRAPHKMGLVIEGRPAGKGMLNVPELLSKLFERGRCQSAILELWTPPEAGLEDTIKKEEQWAGESIKYLKEFFLTRKI